MTDDRDLEDLLKEEGYEITKIPEVVTGIGCIACGDEEAETVNDWCIKCALKTASMHYPFNKDSR